MVYSYKSQRAAEKVKKQRKYKSQKRKREKNFYGKNIWR